MIWIDRVMLVISFLTEVMTTGMRPTQRCKGLFNWLHVFRLDSDGLVI